MSPDLSTAVTVLTTVVTAAMAALGWIAHRLGPRVRQVGHLLDDFAGEAPRAGLPDGRPGIVERVARIEGHLSRLDSIEDHLGIKTIPTQRNP